jgi:putative transposase
MLGRYVCYGEASVPAEAYMLSCGRYIERNPVDAGIVADPWEYRWSSCRAYALGEADPLLARNAHYEELAEAPKRRQSLWREFLSGEDPKEGQVRRSDWVLGGESFRLRMQHGSARPQPRQRGRPARPPNRVTDDARINLQEQVGTGVE